MFSASWYVASWAIIIGVGSICLFGAYAVRCVFQLRFFILSWKTLADCTSAGFNRFMSKAILAALYRKNLLEVRLREHMWSCDQCKMVAMTKLMFSEKFEDLISGLPFDEIETEDVLKLFEEHLFDADTVRFFDFRMIKRPNRRRRFAGLRWPQLLTPQML